ncbi:MAG: hypothetical protein H0U44_10200 [Flavisolibacter sp.]|nr:hypothetical protein [Flavisolibacter sp.]
MKPILFFHFLLLSCGLLAQDKTQTGFLILSSERSGTPFDFFFSCSVDTTKTVKQNMLLMQGGAAMLAFIDAEDFEDDLVDFADTLENEALDVRFANNMKNVLVIPVEVDLADIKKAKFARNEKDVLLDWPVKFFGRTLFSFYNARQTAFKKIRVLQLKQS